MREAAKKRGHADEKPSCYLCADVSMLHDLLMKHMFGISKQPSCIEQQSAMVLLAAGWSLCGCDFVELKGMRSDAVFDSIGQIVRTRPDTLATMHNAWSTDSGDVQKVHGAIKQLLAVCANYISDKPRVKAENIQGILHPDLIVLQRAGWTVSYWCGIGVKRSYRVGSPELGVETRVESIYCKCCFLCYSWILRMKRTRQQTTVPQLSHSAMAV